MLQSTILIQVLSISYVPLLLRSEAQACAAVRPSSVPSTTLRTPTTTSTKATTTTRTTAETTSSRKTTTASTATTEAAIQTSTQLPMTTTTTPTTTTTSTTTMTTTATTTTTTTTPATTTTTTTTTIAPTTTTTTTTPATTTTTTTTTTAPMSCTSCSTNNQLMQSSIGADGVNRDGRAVITVSVVNGCEVAAVTCFADGNRDTLIQVSTGGIPYIMNGGCGMADLPPNLITCNAAGNWVFSVTGEINPTIQCSVTAVGPDC